MSKKDYYEVLEVKKDATSDEIKKAYRRLSKIHHPDKGGDEEVFKKISGAQTLIKKTIMIDLVMMMVHKDNKVTHSVVLETLSQVVLVVVTKKELVTICHF